MAEPGWYIATDFSYDGEYSHGPFDTLEQAQAEAKKLAAENKGQVRLAYFEPYTKIKFNADRLIDDLRDDAEYECGDVGDWLEGITSEQEESLERSVKAAIWSWLLANGLQPTFLVAQHGSKQLVKP